MSETEIETSGAPELLLPSHALVFDVESVGLHGEAFSVGGVIVGMGPEALVELKSFHFWSSPNDARGTVGDYQWVAQNIPTPDEREEKLIVHFDCREDMIEEFWKLWFNAKSDYPGLMMAAECQWPVEARFLLECVDRSRELRNWEGPYPLHDVASFMLAAGMDPMGTYKRLPKEEPAHNPLGDARLSARLMWEAFKLLNAKFNKSET